VRIDKYVWCVRLSKTRSLATKLVAGNKVKLNGLEMKPAKEVAVGDIISIQKNNATFSFRIKALTEKRLGAKLIGDYIVDETPTEEVDKYKTYQAAQRNYRGKDHGKPSKKDRRELDDFLEGW
jgi:ribosome-associated heat shock protein Hsp15|tara:strand:+ start:3968 stop:4336 length:369 start_codon:yes stop_codon:yes gene_type:complete